MRMASLMMRFPLSRPRYVSHNYLNSKNETKNISKQESCIRIDSLVLSDLLAKAGTLSEYTPNILLASLNGLLMLAIASLLSVSLLITLS
jgi:hypothetical protein